jgi:hypothetical protein
VRSGTALASRASGRLAFTEFSAAEIGGVKKMQRQNRWFSVAGLVGATILWSAGTATALPALQLGPGTGPGWSYDTVSETWVHTTAPGGSFDLAAYAIPSQPSNPDQAWDGAGNTASTRYAYLVVSAVPKITFDGFGVTVQNGGPALTLFTSGVGAPPIEDGNDLASHGIFDTYYEIYEFRFDGPIGTVGNTQPGGPPGAFPGYSEVFQITLNSLMPGVTAVHFDLFTIQGDGKMTLPDCQPSPTCPGPYSNFVKARAPFSHDAQTAPIPEPGSTLLFGVGCLVAGIASRARRP